MNEPEVDYGHAPLRRAERMAALLELLTADRTLAVAEVAQRFGVSASTLRRDLQLLQEQKLLERTHGGAVATRAEHELPVRYRTNQQREQKVAIAKIAVARVPLGAVVGLTGGTTTSEVARQLAVRDQLTVVTNALNIAAELSIRPKVKVVVPGGVARPQSYELVGVWDGSKLGRVQLARIAGVDAITEVITDATADPGAIVRLRAAGVTVTIASSPTRL